MLIKKLNHFFLNVTKEFTFTENKNCVYKTSRLFNGNLIILKKTIYYQIVVNFKRLQSGANLL